MRVSAMCKFALVSLVMVVSIAYNAETTAEVADELPTYERVSGVSGNLSSVGSDTLANLMTLWTEKFGELYPNINIQVQAAGSSTAPTALTEGVANFGPMSRRMKDKEIEAFEARFGYKPTPIRVAIDALAVYVHKDNPLESLTVGQVDAIFSSTRRCGHPVDIKTWGDLGLEGTWQRRPIQLYGRNSVSGTYGYFKQAGLCSGDFKNTVNEQPGSASVVQAITASLNGIGYSGVGYVTSGVRAVPIAEVEGDEPVSVEFETASDGTYPFTRYLYVYVNKKPDSPLPPLEREFLKLVLSGPGQEIVEKDGYVPLSLKVLKRELQRLL
ncbi:MAG: phosphate ABC transporter substrate-binding protein PstS family protein [Gammaproteobacteria bacterium]|nr:phosphate ABC transporter substrate-binding protein PstS family protein [Gammaproteobacteria bacterium]MYD79435.1 phosphate ABC transporter substrate-binding protein PstS family protein [Gammaproteobacteria bacterium]